MLAPGSTGVRRLLWIATGWLTLVGVLWSLCVLFLSLAMLGLSVVTGGTSGSDAMAGVVLLILIAIVPPAIGLLYGFRALGDERFAAARWWSVAAMIYTAIPGILTALAFVSLLVLLPDYAPEEELLEPPPPYAMPVEPPAPIGYPETP